MCNSCGEGDKPGGKNSFVPHKKYKYMAYDVVDFQEEVIQASYEKPVLVDFWAPWCGPCRVLGPVLEKLAVEQVDRWKLAKVNTDQNQEVSVQYGIRGIPAVKLFVDGDVVNEFTGALPEHMVRKWLDEAIPTGDKLQLEAAEAAIEAGQMEMAKGILEDLYKAEPENVQVRVRLAQATANQDLAKAASYIEGVEVTDAGLIQLRDAILTLASVEMRGEDGESLPDEEGKEDYLAAAAAVKGRDWDEALSHFIAVIQKNRYYDDDRSRKACIAIFTLLGPRNPMTLKHRRRFDMVLY